MPYAPKSRTRKPPTENSRFAKAPRAGRVGAVDLGRLRSVLAAAPTRTQFASDEGLDDEALTPASVLFPIVLRESGPTVLLTQRTEHLRDHPGQISFPGGRVEAADASAAHTALREAEEEIGLPAAAIEIIGYLPEYRTSTGFRVTPVVAFVTPPLDLRADPTEVAEIFEVPLAFLMDVANHQRHSAHSRGKLRHYFAMPYGDYFIWGVTAGIIVSLSSALAACGEPKR